MRRLSVAALSASIFFVISVFPLFSSDDPEIVEAFRKNYTRGSLTTKIRVLQDSIEFEEVDMSGLYLLSLDFVINNAWMLEDDSSGRELMLLTIRLIGTNKVSTAANDLWKFFSLTRDAGLRIEVMSAIGDTAGGNIELISSINTWLSDCNQKFNSGSFFDEKLIAQTVTSLGKLGDSSSFPIVFTTGTVGYSEIVTSSATEALGNIEGYFTDHIIEVINSSGTGEKVLALAAAFAQSNLSREEKASIAIEALKVGLSTEADSEQQEKELHELRYEAVRQLTKLNWAGETDNLIKHFDSTIFEYEQGSCRKINLVEAIDALGNSGTHDAAVRLTLYLEVMNSYTENGQVVDEQVVLCLINNLGKLGDNVAFDYLLYTGYLNYSGNIQRAAREALKNLKSI